MKPRTLTKDEVIAALKAGATLCQMWEAGKSQYWVQQGSQLTQENNRVTGIVVAATVKELPCTMEATHGFRSYRKRA